MKIPRQAAAVSLGCGGVGQLKARATPRAFNRQHYAALDALGGSSLTGDPRSCWNGDRGAGLRRHRGTPAASRCPWARWSTTTRSTRGTDHVLWPACEFHRHRPPGLYLQPERGAQRRGPQRRERVGAPRHALPRRPTCRPRSSPRGSAVAATRRRCHRALRPHSDLGTRAIRACCRAIPGQARAARLRHLGEASKKIDTVYRTQRRRGARWRWRSFAPGAAIAGGKAYFITNGEPAPQDAVINGLSRPPACRRDAAPAAWAGALSRHHAGNAVPPRRAALSRR